MKAGPKQHVAMPSLPGLPPHPQALNRHSSRDAVRTARHDHLRSAEIDVHASKWELSGTFNPILPKNS
jgi:hypothetical protein